MTVCDKKKRAELEAQILLGLEENCFNAMGYDQIGHKGQIKVCRDKSGGETLKRTSKKISSGNLRSFNNNEPFLYHSL